MIFFVNHCFFSSRTRWGFKFCKKKVKIIENGQKIKKCFFLKKTLRREVPNKSPLPLSLSLSISHTLYLPLSPSLSFIFSLCIYFSYLIFAAIFINLPLTHPSSPKYLYSFLLIILILFLNMEIQHLSLNKYTGWATKNIKFSKNYSFFQEKIIL